MFAADLLIDSRGPDMRHRTGITAPDAFLYIRVDGIDSVFFDAREFGIQKQKIDHLGNAVRVEALEPYISRAQKKEGAGSMMQKTVSLILRDRAVEVLNVSPHLSYAWALYLQDAGFTLHVHDFPSERIVKTEEDIERMIEAQRVTEGAFALARDMLTRASIDGSVLRLQGDVLTSDIIKTAIKMYFLQKGYSCPEGLIVASGEQTSRPHDEGSGPILPHVPIIIDLFPLCDSSGFFADMTRTFVKGTPSEEVVCMIDAVIAVQADVAEGITIGDTGTEIHDRTVKAFNDRHFETTSDGGFIHGTGHGLGLAVHELPNLKTGATTQLGPGMVVTVEPGLYYQRLGGARIEDVVLFHEDGRKENITQFPTDYLLP